MGLFSQKAKFKLFHCQKKNDNPDPLERNPDITPCMSQHETFRKGLSGTAQGRK